MFLASLSCRSSLPLEASQSFADEFSAAVRMRLFRQG